ncbi:MAG: peptide chain release factor-like protein [bacterium]|nr:peptide chain release factor-like protein [bacterium]
MRAGAGGDEAGLFASELWRMYHSFAQRRGFKTEIVDSSQSDVGGIKTLVAEISAKGGSQPKADQPLAGAKSSGGEGKDVYDLLKYESGIHRVQRIPKTEKSGRIHTSTVSIAVLKEVPEKEVVINAKDIRTDTFRASGPGGQNVNKVESAIRITHLASGIVVSSQTQRSQLQNRERAMAILRAKLAEIEKEKALGQITSERKSQIGTGERVEKIRTYNFPQNRITDHRIGKSWHNMEKILDGNIEPIIEALAKNLEQKTI